MAINALLKLAIAGLNHPATKSLAKKLIKNVSAGNTLKVNKQASLLSRALGKATQSLSQTKSVNPNFSLRQDLNYNPLTHTAGKQIYGHFKKTPMIDIDVKGASHFARNVHHQGKPEALKGLFDYLKTPPGKKSLFATYETPGGIRLFDLSRRTTPQKYYNPTRESGRLNLKLGGDPDYPVYNIKRGAYASRFTPKPGRDRDYVAKLIDYYGSGQAIPKNVLEVKKYHDTLIKRILESPSKEEINIGGLLQLIGK